MEFNQFKSLAEKYNTVPVYERITADLLTPVLAYIKIRRPESFCFLLESVEGIGRLARYSFIGVNPSKVFFNHGKEITIKQNGTTKKIEQNIFDFLKSEIDVFNHPRLEELPDFTGGIIGYLGFENVAYIEDVIKFDGIDETEQPDSLFGVFNTILAFDHYKHQIILISNVNPSEYDSPEEAYNDAKSKLENLRRQVSIPLSYISNFKMSDEETEKFYVDEFFKEVEMVKNNIYEGDVFQLVLSRRFSCAYKGDLLNVYRALRIINPSPYMYFMEYQSDLTIIGTSPEDLVKVKDNKATILPIAGTRRRGKTEKEDLELEENLLNDPKEIAEHMMLVDLARNDLGRVCDYDTVSVTEELNIHRFSHVMHIVSRVEGTMLENKDCIDALTASFPAGTVSGAPKIRAIQLINQYEKLKRNIYAGAVGYIDYNGNLDMCIAIRTLFADKDRVYWQAGAGIVADSQPKLELKEIRNKSAVLKSALEYAEVIDENINN